MGFVTIEGSVMPSVDLARGERRTVEVTDYIRTLVRIGAAVVVSGSLRGEPADHTGTTLDDPSGDTPLPTGDFAPAGETLAVVGSPTVEIPADGSAPAKNAKREVWAAFLTSKGVVFPDGDEDAGEQWAGRDDLIIIWQQASGGS